MATTKDLAIAHGIMCTRQVDTARPKAQLLISQRKEYVVDGGGVSGAVNDDGPRRWMLSVGGVGDATRA